MIIFENNRDFAARLDRGDPLARFRDAFNFPRDRDGRRPVYLCGNSLGLQPQRAVELGKQAARYATRLDWHSVVERFATLLRDTAEGMPYAPPVRT